MKNNIEYYQHFTNSHNNAKFKMLRIEYGWEGEGKFWALNNMIASASDCFLDLSKKYNKATIASDLDFKIDEFDKFIDYLYTECGLIILDNEQLTTKIVQENFNKVQKKRSHDQKVYRKRTDSVPNSESDIPNSELIQKKRKEKKVKEIKLKENKKISSQAKPDVSDGVTGEYIGKSSVPYFEIIDFLNTTLNTKYKYKSDYIKKRIKARFNEGFTIDDFKEVIERKYQDWHNDSKMQKFLRPETLFGTKFQGYLNEVEEPTIDKKTYHNVNVLNKFIEGAGNER